MAAHSVADRHGDPEASGFRGVGLRGRQGVGVGTHSSQQVLCRHSRLVGVLFPPLPNGLRGR